jgi:hypothetical protein
LGGLYESLCLIIYFPGGVAVMNVDFKASTKPID